MPTRFADLIEYATSLQSHLSRHGLISEATKISVKPKAHTRNRDGLISVTDVTFRSGATLTGFELASVQDAQILRSKYKYHYRKDDFFFRYCKDIEAALGRPYEHAECHLHVSGDAHAGVRYITHETNLEEMLEFLWATFEKG